VLVTVGTTVLNAKLISAMGLPTIHQQCAPQTERVLLPIHVTANQVTTVLNVNYIPVTESSVQITLVVLPTGRA